MTRLVGIRAGGRDRTGALGHTSLSEESGPPRHSSAALRLSHDAGYAPAGASRHTGAAIFVPPGNARERWDGHPKCVRLAS